jgi:septum formation protein
VRLARSLVLASASPRRRELLQRLGLSFAIEAADLDETRLADEPPRSYVVRLAAAKVRAIAARTPGPCALLGADTTVVLDGRVLNKPSDEHDSARMLGALRGREHVVYTAVALLLHPEGTLSTSTVATRVLFRAFDDATLARYVASGEGMDKAGSYGIQDLGAALVREVHGSYTNVVGLPAAETIELLEAAGVLQDWP